MKRTIRTLSCIILFICFTLFGAIHAYAETDSVQEYVESKGYQYFNSYQEAYDYVENLFNQLPIHTPILSENMTFIAYKGEANDDIINDFVFSEKDLESYAGNRVYNSVLEASTQRTGNRTSNSFDSYGLSSYIILYSWRTYWVKKDYISDEQFYEAYDLAQNIANQLNYGTDYEKAARAYEWVCSNISYDNDNHKASMYSALKYGETICTGYAQSFFQICEDMGINCKIVYSKTHAYNLIQLDGEWYIADTTQDAEHDKWDYNCMFVGTNNEYLQRINDGRYGDNIYEDIPVSGDDYVPYIEENNVDYTDNNDWVNYETDYELDNDEIIYEDVDIEETEEETIADVIVKTEEDTETESVLGSAVYDATSVQDVSSEYIEYADENNIDRNNAKHNLVYMAILVLIGGTVLCVVLFTEVKKYK